MGLFNITTLNEDSENWNEDHETDGSDKYWNSNFWLQLLCFLLDPKLFIAREHILLFIIL